MATSLPDREMDRDLLFGVVALQAALLDNDQFAEACLAWIDRRGQSLANLLIERGWISSSDKIDVERILQRKLKKHNDDPRASLAASADNEVRRVLAMLHDLDIDSSLAELPGDGEFQLSTIDPIAQTRKRYRLTRLHAKGGIGQVWVARDSEIGREVALKELRPERRDSISLAARFIQEARITGQLEHPGIVPIYELARQPDGNQSFYTMRFVRGQTLSEAAQAFHAKRSRAEAGPLDQAKLLNAFIGVCNAVAYAHSRGVVHRDLKGCNVILGDFGEVVVLDWGLAKLVGNAANIGDEAGRALEQVQLSDAEGHAPTVAGNVLGTPAYMAPEQAEGRLEIVNQRTDIYGLGAILYELLTGKAPFSGANNEEVLHKVVHEQPITPQLLNPQAPSPLEAVCLKAMAKKQADRYGSASELAAEMQRFLADEPVLAYREPWWVRAGRWARRHRTLTVSSAVGLVVASLILFVMLLIVEDANRKLTVEIRRSEKLLAQMSESDEAMQMVLNEYVVSELVPGPMSNPKDVRTRLDDMTKRAYKRFDGHPAVLSTALNFLANLYSNLWEDAEDERDRQRVFHLLDEALKLRLSAHGLEHPATLQSVNNYWLFEKEDPAAVKSALRQNLADCQRILGADHSLARTARHNYAWALYNDDRFEEAEKEIREVLKTRPAFDTHAWEPRDVLAACLAAQGRHSEASGLSRDNWKLSDLRFGSDHRRTVWSRYQLGEYELEAGNHKEAAGHLRAVVEAHTRAPHTQPLKKAQTLVQLGRALLEAAAPVEAEKALQECYSIRQKHWTDGKDWRLGYTKMLLGAALVRQKKYAEAESLLVDGCNEMEKLAQNIPAGIRQARLNEAVTHVIAFYDAKSEKEKAKHWRKKLNAK